MNEKDLALIYVALLRNDGNTLCPDWPAEKRNRLSLALDELRSDILTRSHYRPGTTINL